MFLRMVKGALTRQKGKMVMIAFTILLGSSLATAMLNIMFDVGDKVNQELKAYGANIIVKPKDNSVIEDLYEVDGADEIQSSYLQEDEIGKIKTIFWTYSIVDFAPFLETTADVNGTPVTVTGSWFNHHLSLPSGEELDAGIVGLRSWWDIEEGEWLDEKVNPDGIMVGTTLAQTLGVHVGDRITLTTDNASENLLVVGIYNSGGEEDDQMITNLDVVQELANTGDLISSIEVSALTSPDDELAQKAARDPMSLSVSEYEVWYCTAYVSSICYQIQEVIPDAVASPVRQVADSEGAIMEKTQLLMILITILSLLGSALGISNLVTASVMERSNEIGLLKAIGAKDGAVSGLVLTEILITAVVGGIAGYFVGYGFAQIIGKSVFDSSIEMKPIVIPIVSILIILVTLAGSIPAIRMLLKMKPAEVLHGR